MNTNLGYDALGADVKPVHYNLFLYNLRLSGNPSTYSGRVEIDIVVLSSTRKIVLNSYLLRIDSATVTNAEASTTHACKVSYNEEEERCSLRLDHPLELSSQPARLTIVFRGQIDDDLSGFFRFKDPLLESSKFQHGYTCCTQFQPSDARRAFPCFDQPALKATFNLSIQVPKGLLAISNMPVLSLEQDDSESTTSFRFQQTPIMSTYLLAWSIGGFEYLESSIPRMYSSESIPVRICTPPGLKHTAQFALDLTCKIVPYFSKIFGVDYPLPKLDILGVLEMSDDAMENWGLLIFRTSALLVEPDSADPESIMTVAYVLAHEIAHQWFGNLVTMEWWDDLWLNEGFATWAGWAACEEMFPEWDVWGIFILDDMRDALDLDSLPSSHPVRVHVPNDLEVDTIFDYITYLKSSTLIRMLVAHIGQDTFLRGVTEYLKKHAYGNATAYDLWHAISSTSGQDIMTLMNPWITKRGFPLIEVEMVAPSSISIKEASNSESKGMTIPIRTQIGTSTHQDLLSKNALTYNVGSMPFIVNIGQTGFFRVIYPRNHLQGLAQSINELSPHDQIGVLGDALALTWIGKESCIDLVFSMMLPLQNSTDPNVWTAITHVISQLQSAFGKDKETSLLLDRFASRLVEPLAQSLGWEFLPDDNFKTKRLRVIVISLAGSSGNGTWVRRICETFDEWQKGNDEAIHPFLRPTVFAIAVKFKGNNAMRPLWETYTEDHAGDDRDTIASAMGNLQDPEAVRKCLSRAFNGEMLTQDISTLVTTLATNATLQDLLYNYIKDHWKLVFRKLGGSMAIFDPFMRDFLRWFSSFDQEKDICKFFATKDTMGYQGGLSVGCDFIKANAAFELRERDNVKAWLRSNNL